MKTARLHAPAHVASDSWRVRGACWDSQDPRWFPDLSLGGKAESRGPHPEVVATCLACPVSVECLDYALATRPRFGVWGGLSAEQIRRRRRSGGEFEGGSRD